MKKEKKKRQWATQPSRGAGDSGTSTIFGTVKRIPKTEEIFEALGSLDELVSLLGWVRAKTPRKTREIVLEIQNQLFTVQAEVAGCPMCLSESEVKKVEDLIYEIESRLSPQRCFVIPGETELSAMFDVARTVCRRAERAVLRYSKNKKKISPSVLAYLNRLSSLLFVLARQSAEGSGITEKRPKYKV